jgi:hypothetical protein
MDKIYNVRQKNLIYLRGFRRYWPYLILSGLLALLMMSCGTGLVPQENPVGEESNISSTEAKISPEYSATTVPMTGSELVPIPQEIQFGYTHHQPDGNRFVHGEGSLPDTQSLDIQLAGTPKWLVAAPFGDGSVWAAVLDDGRVQAFSISNGVAEGVLITPPQLPPGMPPVLIVDGGELMIVRNLTPEASVLTHPVPLPPSGDHFAFITSNGVLVITGQDESYRINVDAMEDARILTDGTGRWLLLTNGTNNYDHGVLGDRIEAAGFTLVGLFPEPGIITSIMLEDSTVIEGIAPIWADLNGDGLREIIVTQSDVQDGAQIVVYGEDGSILAVGPPIGQGYRWRHQLAVAPFAPTGHLELAVVRTPHIGGIVEFYQMVGDKLSITAQTPGFSTHTIGSRNLDNALAGDFDGDGRIELLLPDQAHTTLGALRRTGDRAELVWSLSLDGRISTNLAAVTISNGRIGVGVGTENNILRLWVP